MQATRWSPREDLDLLGGVAVDIDMGIEVGNDRHHCPTHLAGANRVDRAARLIHRGELQTLQDNAVVIVDQWTIREQGFSLGKGLVRIVRQNALIEALDRRQGWTVTQQDVEELQGLHVPTQDHQAEGQGRRHDQPDRTPQPGPEHRRDDDRDRR